MDTHDMITSVVTGIQVDTINLMRTEIVGLQFHDYPLMVRYLTIGTELDLVREQENKYDGKAVAVYCAGNKIGFLPREVNESFAAMLDRGVVLYGIVTEHNAQAGIMKGQRRLVAAIYMNHTVLIHEDITEDQVLEKGTLCMTADGFIVNIDD